RAAGALGMEAGARKGTRALFRSRGGCVSKGLGNGTRSVPLADIQLIAIRCFLKHIPSGETSAISPKQTSASHCKCPLMTQSGRSSKDAVSDLKFFPGDGIFALSVSLGRTSYVGRSAFLDTCSSWYFAGGVCTIAH